MKTQKQFPAEFILSGQLLVKLLRRLPVSEKQVVLGGLIASVAGAISNDDWKAMLIEAAKPCGTPDCGCEKMTMRVMVALDELRTDYQEQTGFDK